MRLAWPVSGGNAVVLEACIELESDPALVGVARHFVDQTVVEWELDPIREDARLIATDLVSNAVLHARTECRLTLRSNGFDFLPHRGARREYPYALTRWDATGRHQWARTRSRDGHRRVVGDAAGRGRQSGVG